MPLHVKALDEMSEVPFRHITYDYPMSVAKGLARLNPRMTFTYVTGADADSSERGRTVWAPLLRVSRATTGSAFKGVRRDSQRVTLTASKVRPAPAVALSRTSSTVLPEARKRMTRHLPASFVNPVLDNRMSHPGVPTSRLVLRA